MKPFVCFAALLAFAVAPVVAEELYFSRTFPRSVPPFFDVTLNSDGSGGYREALDEEPLEFTVSPETIEMLWAHVQALDLSADLSAKRKVAFTGDKVLRFTRDDGKQGEAKFMYTENPEAQALVSWFTKASETAKYRIDLERVIRFDRLGVNDALLRLQSAMDRGRVVAPEQLVPVLEQIVAQKNILHMARSRASAILERIQPPAAPESPVSP